MNLANQLLELLSRHDLLDEDLSVADLQKLAKELLDKFFKGDNLPMPRIAIKHNIAAGWLGLCRWKRGSDNTDIWIQKAIIHSDDTSRRVMTHELVHHWVFLTGQSLRGKSAGHQGAFLKKAAEINQEMGDGYVTEFSDSQDDVKHTKEFYVIIQPRANVRTPSNITHEYGWTTSVTPSAMQKAEIAARIKDKEARVFKTSDRTWINGSPIKRLGGYSIPRDQERKDQLKDLYLKGKQAEVPGMHAAAAKIGQDVSVTIEIFNPTSGAIVGTYSGDALRRNVKAKSGTVDDWIKKFNVQNGYLIQARRKETKA